MLCASGLLYIVNKLGEGQFAKGLLGGLGQLVIDDPRCDLAGAKLAGGDVIVLIHGQAALKSADKVAKGYILGQTRQAISPAAADLTFEESAAAKRQEDGLQELIGNGLLFSQIMGLHVALWRQLSQPNNRL